MLHPVKDEGAQAKLAHPPTPTTENFPLPAKPPFTVASVNKRDQALVLPAKSSFRSLDENQSHAISTPPSMDHGPVAPENGQGTLTDFSTTSSVEGSLRQDLGRKRSPLHKLPFREPDSSTREKVHRDSVILAEVKTNVIVRDELLFLNEFSQHLSQRYRKPTSSIFITLDHSACLLFTSSFDSAYILTITALPSQILPSANKHNAALIQSFIKSSLGVLPDRGVVKFVGIPDDYLATAGTTIQGQANRLEKLNNEKRKPSDMPLLQPFPNPQSYARQTTTPKEKPPALSLMPKIQSMPGSKMPSPTPDESPVIPAMPIPKAPSVLDRKVERTQRSRIRKSIMTLFGR